MKDLGEGIKTTMNLVRVSNNHFTIMDDDVVKEGNKHQDRVSGGQPHATGVGTIYKHGPTQSSNKVEEMDCEVSDSRAEGDAQKGIMQSEFAAPQA